MVFFLRGKTASEHTSSKNPIKKLVSLKEVLSPIRVLLLVLLLLKHDAIIGTFH